MFRLEKLAVVRLNLGVLVLLTGTVAYRLLQPVYAAGILFRSARWMSILGAAGLAVLLLTGALGLTWGSRREWLAARLEDGFRQLQRLGKLNLGLFLLGIGLFDFLVLGRYGIYLEDLVLRLAFGGILILAGAVLLGAAGAGASWVERLGAAALFLALGYRLGLYSAEISATPFTLNWSEASRYYYASLFFSNRIYGITVPPTVLHPSRYLLQAIPFLIADAPIWAHRAWQVLLWIVSTAASGYVVARRVRPNGRLQAWMLFAWSCLFLLLGPVYYHLQIVFILVVAGFERKKPWRSLGLVLLASAWAGISRVNWFPLPGMLAAMLYFLEEPSGQRPAWRYWLWPSIWAALGVVTAFGAQTLYAVLSGNPPDQFASSLSSDLLWYRLFPNPTYPLGILLSTLLVCGPPFLFLLGAMHAKWRHYNPLRLAGIGLVLSAFLGGGLVVSTKIGGGSNLHNLDAFLALLVVVCAYVLWGRLIPEPVEEESPRQAAPYRGAGLVWQWTLWGGLILALLLPVYATAVQGGPIDNEDWPAIESSLERLNRITLEAVSEGGEVLFISERQLLTFGVIQGVELAPDYEKVFLMEMAMSGSPEYLGQFWNDLENQRFALIVTEPLFTRLKGRLEPFGEENDVWVRNVSQKVLCYYTPSKRLRDVSLQLLVPKSASEVCTGANN